MSALDTFEQQLTDSEHQILQSLKKPADIQAFLDTMIYSADPFYRCPLRALRERVAHCFDGAMFAAACLYRIGFPPLILDIIPNDRDDDHLLALYKTNGYWGAVAKSNFVGLRFREPVYSSLRELLMSYFEQYYNVEREKTMRGYTMPLSLNRFDKFNWMTSDEPLELIAQRLDQIRRVTILTPTMIETLSLLDERSYLAGLYGSNEAGLYNPAVSDPAGS